MKNLDYGVIGNGQSAALVSRYGSIHWLCLPVFDGPSVFAHILDPDRGGEFAIEPEGHYRVSQAYLRKSNILVTSFTGDESAFDVYDFMPRYKTASGQYHCPADVIRYINPVRGAPKIRIKYHPRPGYAQHAAKSEITSDYIKTYTDGRPYESIYLYSDLDLDAIAGEEPIAIERECFLVLSYNQKLIDLDINSVLLEFERTKVYWMGWTAESKFLGRYHDTIERSSLVLKLLAYQKTGAVLAALTTSIPEELNGVRNWDYRYCWLRDASMIIRIFTDLGHYNVGRRYLQFLLDIVPYKDEKIQIMYGIDGRRNLEERALDWLAGYAGSKPVRVGNAAYVQKQNDIFGLVMDTIFQKLIVHQDTLDNKEEIWTTVRTLARHVEHNWGNPDAGIWEIRSGVKHFTFSKVLCWVAFDRAVKIAMLFGAHDYVRIWSKMRQKIKKEVLANAWNDDVGAFTQAYGNPSLDASTLLLEHYGFVDATDPRYVSTVRAIDERLCEDGLMYRYRTEDDFGHPSTSFTVCSFWMIKGLYRIGQTERAHAMFEQLLTYSNHVGLFSEDIEIDTKRLLGNFPQGYSHLALIDTAIALSEEDRVLGPSGDPQSERAAREDAEVSRELI